MGLPSVKEAARLPAVLPANRKARLPQAAAVLQAEAVPREEADLHRVEANQQHHRLPVEQRITRIAQN